MPAHYPKGNEGTPKTDSNAKVTRYRTVHGVPAIRVRGATYRGSQALDGVFELVSAKPQRVAGGERYEVYCAWFGVKPPTKYPRIAVDPGNYEILADFSGEVGDNISSKA